MKKVIILFCLGLLLGAVSPASAIDDLFGIPDLRFGGYLKNATALRLLEPHNFLKIDNIVDLRLTYEPKTLPLKFYIEVRPEYDGAFDMQHKGVGSDAGLDPENRGIGIGRKQFTAVDFKFPGFPRGVNLRDNWQDTYMRRLFLLREAWVDYRIDNFDIKLGKQQVAWGKTDGFRLLDILNPTDYREFLLMDPEDSRIPIWMANIKYYITPKHNLQFIWMPWYVRNFQAPPGSPWALNPINSIQLLATLPYARVADKEPAQNLLNSDFGFRYEGQIGTKFDFTINYLHRWDQNNVWPALVKVIPAPFTLIFLEKPERQNIFGGSFTTTFSNLLGLKDLVMRGEIAYFYRRTMWQLETNSPIDRDNLQAVIGFDKNVAFLGKFWLLSFQIFEDAIFGSRPHPVSSLGGDVKKRHEEDITVLVSTDFWNQTLKPEVLFVWSLTHNSSWIRPRVSYDITDRLKASLGFNFFTGKAGISNLSGDALGQMKRNDHVFAEIKWSF